VCGVARKRHYLFSGSCCLIYLIITFKTQKGFKPLKEVRPMKIWQRRCKFFSFNSISGFGISLVVLLLNNRSLSLMNKWFDPFKNN